MSSAQPPQKGTFSRLERVWTGSFLVIGGLLLTVLMTRPPPPPPPPHLDEVLARGVLRVATVNSPVTYYSIQEQSKGLEFDLARAFANQLGVDLQMMTMDSFAQVLAAVDDGRADLAAANITATEARTSRVAFSTPYQQTTQYVVYKSGQQKPRSTADLIGREITVVADSSYAETLQQLSQQMPALNWHTRSTDIESLFTGVSEGRYDLTVADSTVLDIQQRFFPRLRRAFALTDPQPVAWAFPDDRDRSLLDAADLFIADVTATGQLSEIKDRYHAHIAHYNRTNSHYFLRHIRSRLPTLKPYFLAASETTGIDWRLLAAIGYAESHWRPEAVSPTGVKGVMMLTRATAQMMGVTQREDAAQSIMGGARYLERVDRKIPRRIRQPDRTWLALAAYNIGFSHLEDARILTQRAGGDPDRWEDVVGHLPKLNQPEWYRSTRHGYSRGREAAAYVRNIQSYYDILNWAMNQAATEELQIAP